MASEIQETPFVKDLASNGTFDDLFVAVGRNFFSFRKYILLSHRDFRGFVHTGCALYRWLLGMLTMCLWIMVSVC